MDGQIGARRAEGVDRLVGKEGERWRRMVEHTGLQES